MQTFSTKITACSCCWPEIATVSHQQAFISSTCTVHEMILLTSTECSTTLYIRQASVTRTVHFTSPFTTLAYFILTCPERIPIAVRVPAIVLPYNTHGVDRAVHLPLDGETGNVLAHHASSLQHRRIARNHASGLPVRGNRVLQEPQVRHATRA